MMGNKAEVSITRLSKAAVLAALYNASRPLGMGFMHFNPMPMTTKEAEEILLRSTYFDYLNGRVMKVDLGQDNAVDCALYDRDNGPGSGERAIASLRTSSDVNDLTIRAAHGVGTEESASRAEEAMKVNSTFAEGVLVMGLGDVAETLQPRVEKARKALNSH